MNSHKCQICRRELTNAESIARGIGPECAARYASGVASCGSSVERIDALALHDDAEINRWLHVAKLAIGRGRIGDARSFIAQAEKIASSSAISRNAFTNHSARGITARTAGKSSRLTPR